MKRAAITGWGLLSPIGHDADAAWSALMEGKSGIGPIPDWPPIKGLRSHVCGQVVGIDEREAIPRSRRRTMGRVAILGAHAAQTAVRQAGLEPSQLASSRVGVIIGSTIGSAAAFNSFFSDFVQHRDCRRVEGTTFMKLMSHTVASNVAACLGVRGHVYAPCSACASSAQAIGLGLELIRTGVQDVVICGGAEELHETALITFDALRVASSKYNDQPTLTPRPFDTDRDGVVISEGAAILVLESEQHALSRGAVPLGWIAGYGSTCNPEHMSRPSEDSMAACMEQALIDAEINATEIDYVNCHATGTLFGDVAEAEALRRLVADRAPVSGTKGHTGHTLAASGATEAILCLLMMQQGRVAPTLNLDRVDPQCDGLWHVTKPLDHSIKTVLTNSFALGGVNASLVMQCEDA